MKNGNYYSTKNKILYKSLNLIDRIFKNKQNNLKLPKGKKFSFLIVRIIVKLWRGRITWVKLDQVSNFDLRRS